MKTLFTIAGIIIVIVAFVFWWYAMASQIHDYKDNYDDDRK